MADTPDPVFPACVNASIILRSLLEMCSQSFIPWLHFNHEITNI